MRLSFLGFVTFISVLPSAFGDRRRLQYDKNTLGWRRLEFSVWSDKHNRSIKEVSDNLFRAKSIREIHSLGKAKEIVEDVMYLFLIGIGICVVLVVLCFLRRLLEKMFPQKLEPEKFVPVLVLRSSGEELVTLHADRSWSGGRVREEVSKHISSGEYMCQLVWDSDDGFEVTLLDYQYLVVVGLADRYILRAITRPCCAAASGVSLFVGHWAVGVSRQKARIWLHEDMSAILILGGIAEAVTMEGHLDEAGNLKFTCDECNVIGLLQGTYGRQEIVLFEAPILGNASVKQCFVEAMFDLSQSSRFDGWLTFFCHGEVVLRMSPKKVEDCGNVSTHLCLWWQREVVDSGTTKIVFSCVGDVHEWKSNFDRGGAAVLKKCSGRWSGSIGKRTLLLDNFPSIGKIKLLEHPIRQEREVSK